MKLHRQALVLDLSTAPLPNAAEFVDGDAIQAPSNWKDPAKIEAYKTEQLAERISKAALDFDLARITGAGVMVIDSDKDPVAETTIAVARDEDDERALIEGVSLQLRDRTLIGYNGKAFDWPLLMRRARYLGVSPVPYINIDRYKSPHHDLLELLSGHDPSRRRPLGFYVKRLSMGLIKPLSGAQEAAVPETGDWDGLKASLQHDVEAVYRLAQWWGVL
jgi:hypothetical protein